MGLRVMVFDKSDTKKNVLSASLPEELNFVDDFINQYDLDISRTQIWRYGSWLYRALPGPWHMDYSAGFDNWGEALEWLATVGGDEPIDEIQYWGHGSPGKVWMKNQVLHTNSFSEFSNWGHLLEKVKTRLHKDSLVWFRTCSTFCGEPGHRFAVSWTNNLQCKVAAHTHIIHVLQAGLHTLAPGNDPHWSTTEGVKTGTPARPSQIYWSGLRSPNNILALRNKVPKGW